MGDGMMQKLALLFAIAAACATMAAAQGGAAQSTAASSPPLRGELALDYSYVHTNAPPGGCTCFGLNGGSATFAWPVRARGFALAGDVTAGHAGSIGGTRSTLTLSTYTAGPRYLLKLGRKEGGSPLVSFGEVLVGAAYASGPLVLGQKPGVAFATNIGGGVDEVLSPRLSFRLVEATYLLTAVNNGVNQRQNNLRLSAGIVMHF